MMARNSQLDHQIKITQWNSRGIQNKKIHFPILLQDTDILILSETWLKDKNNIRFPGFSRVIRGDRSSDGGGVLIAAKVNIDMTEITLQQDIFNAQEFDTCACRIQVEGERNLVIFSIYRPPDKNTSVDTWRTLLNEIKNISKTDFLIIAGDLNTQHRTWGSHRDNPSGRNLYQALEEMDLFALNDGTSTFVRPGVLGSVPDITLVDLDLAKSTNWNVSDDLLGSDHKVIRFTCFDTEIKKSFKRPSIQTKLVKWNIFQELIDKEKSNIKTSIDNCDVGEAYRHFSQVILDSVIEAGGKESHPYRSYSTPPNLSKIWWNKDCEEAVERRREAWKTFEANQSDENHKNYIMTDKETKKILKQERKSSFKRFAESLNPSSNLKRVYDTIKRFNNCINNTWSAPNEATESEIMRTIDKLAPASAEIPLKVNEDRAVVINNVWTKVEIHEVKEIIKKLKINSAAGRDKISNEMITHLPESAVENLTALVNKCLECGDIPEEWTQYDVCLIPKSGKGYRPISLAPCLLKFLERCIQTRLTYLLETDYILPNNQNGFRSKRSCLDNVNILMSDIYRGLANQEFIFVTFLDIQGAYDNVVPQILIDNFEELRVPVPVVKIYAKLLQRKDLNIYCNGKLIANRIARKGLGQGLVTSPGAYNTYNRKFNDCLLPDTSAGQYADDVGLWTADKDYERGKKRIAAVVNNAVKHFDSLGLKISTAKTQFMVFHRKRNAPRIHSIEILGEEIHSVDKAKFLGVIFDEKMTWEPFVKDIKEKCSKATNLIKMLTKHSWGIHPSTALNVYKGLVRSRLEWGVQCSLSSSKTRQNALNREQYKALRVVLGVLPSTPTNIILDLAKEPSINLRAEHLTQRYLARCRASLRNPIPAKLQAFENSRSHKTPKYCLSLLHRTWLEEKDNLNTISREDQLPCYSFPLPAQLLFIEVDLEPGKAVLEDPIKNPHKFTEFIERKWPNWTHIYTDGSKDAENKNVGLSFYIPSLKKGFGYKIKEFYNIFEAESLAILQALRYAKDNFHNNILVCSDSQSALRALGHPEVSTKTHLFTLEIKSIISRLRQQGVDVVFVWTPAHIGIDGNERADELAKLASVKGKPLNLKDYHHNMYKHPSDKSVVREEEIGKIQFTEKGVDYDKLRDKKSKIPWFLEIPLSRRAITTVNRIRSGHFVTNSYLFKIKKKDSAMCQCGFHHQDLQHLFQDCPGMEPHSRALKDLLACRGAPEPYIIRNLAFTNDPYIIRGIAIFTSAVEDFINPESPG